MKKIIQLSKGNHFAKICQPTLGKNQIFNDKKWILLWLWICELKCRLTFNYILTIIHLVHANLYWKTNQTHLPLFSVGRWLVCLLSIQRRQFSIQCWPVCHFSSCLMDRLVFCFSVLVPFWCEPFVQSASLALMTLADTAVVWEFFVVDLLRTFTGRCIQCWITNLFSTSQ